MQDVICFKMKGIKNKIELNIKINCAGQSCFLLKQKILQDKNSDFNLQRIEWGVK
jgi:hypothetical protein